MTPPNEIAGPEGHLRAGVKIAYFFFVVLRFAVLAFPTGFLVAPGIERVPPELHDTLASKENRTHGRYADRPVADH
jgi:hypothetical protein